MKKVIVIAGVTASGKSKLGVALAKALQGEIISADSVAVYNELNIGSAKPTVAEQEGIRHHLINVQSIEKAYNVAQFQQQARECIDAIYRRGKVPIVVGGTGLYINALIYDYEFALETPQANLMIPEDNQQLIAEILAIDPLALEQIHPNNRKRLERTYTRLKTHGKNPETKKHVPVYDACIFFLQGDREKLYERMNQRVDLMFQQGLLQEVQELVRTVPDVFSRNAMSSIGYREFESYFAGDISLEMTKETIQKNTRRFAKRQITWFKHQTPSISVDVFADDFQGKVMEVIRQFLKVDISEEI